MTQQPLQIVVLGAGYAGMLTTARLAGRVKRDIQRGRVAITLINAADVFVERLRLHQLAANRPIVDRPITGILRDTGVEFRRGVVTGIDPAQHTIDVHTDGGGESLGYDHLVYALGSTIDRDSVPGVREHANVLTPSGPRSAAALREVLPTLHANGRGGRLLVCGGGATGIEAAAEFAQAYPDLEVQLVTRGEFGQFMPPGIAAYMYRALVGLGASIQDQTTITEVRAGEALTASGAVLPHDVCLWAGGFTVPHLARAAGLAVNEQGQILIDPFMRSVSHPDVYAVGDAAHPLEAPGVAMRMAAFTAVVMGAHGADCLSATLHGRNPKPLSFAYAGQAIALGQHDAIGFNTYPDDRPHRPYFRGRLGYEVREFFVRLLADVPNLERRWPGAFLWLGKGRYAATKRQGLKAATAQPLRHD
jgi:NADH:quinone reductase (non-electrogenic)